MNVQNQRGPAQTQNPVHQLISLVASQNWPIALSGCACLFPRLTTYDVRKTYSQYQTAGKACGVTKTLAQNHFSFRKEEVVYYPQMGVSTSKMDRILIRGLTLGRWGFPATFYPSQGGVAGL